MDIPYMGYFGQVRIILVTSKRLLNRVIGQKGKPIGQMTRTTRPNRARGSRSCRLRCGRLS
ncbi:hypothetical protein E2C01_080273 [Portunus trituberculatus]|uniref:Uncharacterized protein n=1 Tax=Portunus trituberculatus TaxID=210409 RepID=A0A5B7IZ46_PORTR|nr:hypothetical protein [Portunus trituberculatus]